MVYLCQIDESNAALRTNPMVESNLAGWVQTMLLGLFTCCKLNGFEEEEGDALWFAFTGTNCPKLLHGES